jgi:AraC-like DNA-binding protein
MDKNGKTVVRPARNAGRVPRTEFELTVIDVIDELMEGSGTAPTIAAVADRLRMNIRTVQRHLERAGLPFRFLLSECRQERALLELSESKRPVSEVSGRLGYSDPAHFARAFRRWTGCSPSEYRRRLLQ